MKNLFWLLLALSLAACQPAAPQTAYLILDGEKNLSLRSDAHTPAAILAEAGVTLASADKVEYRGAELPFDFPLPPAPAYTLQILRAHRLTLVTPDGQTSFLSTGASVGQALAQAGLEIYADDFIAPAPETPLTADLTVTYRPARELTINVDGKTLRTRSAALSIGRALASAGVALTRLDRSQPAETAPLPADGLIQVIRVRETVTLVEKPIPFSKKIEYSTDLAVGEQKVIQPGQTGLVVSRIRTRYENGVEVSRVTEAETTLRQPTESLIRLGSKTQILTLDIPGGQVQYWRAVQMYATSYSPCRSGTPKCSYGTASGLPVKQGVVAMTRSLFSQLQGAQVYIPGYGLAVIADVGGGFPDGRLWIDLGYSDEDYQGWSGWVTVYFLVPAPANIPAVLE